MSKVINFLNKAEKKIKSIVEDKPKERIFKSSEQKKKEEAVKERIAYLEKLKKGYEKKQIRQKFLSQMQRKNRPNVFLRTAQGVRINQAQARQFLMNQNLNASILNEQPWLQGDFEAKRLERELNGFNGVSNEGDQAAFKMAREVSLGLGNIGMFEVGNIDAEVWNHAHNNHKRSSKSVSREAWDFSNLVP